MRNPPWDGRKARVRPRPKLLSSAIVLFRFAWMAMIASGLLIGLRTGAWASDGDLQRALLEAGCVKADIKPLPSRGEASIYQANCFGSSHKVIDVVCVAGRCTVSNSSRRRDEIPASR
jgi:hypothetical protein